MSLRRSTRCAPWLFGLAGVLLFPSAVAAETGVLPLHGPPALANLIGEQIFAALKAKDVTLIQPAAFTERLAATTALRDALHAARRSIEAAEDLAVRMKRVPALRAADRAVAQLSAVAARLWQPSLVARAQLARGTALLLYPADREGALRSFSEAFAADPSYQPDPDHVPSRTARLLLRARQAAGSPAPPTAEELHLLASSSSVARLIWARAHSAERSGQPDVTFVAYDAQQRTLVGPESIRAPLDRAGSLAAARLLAQLQPAPPQPSRTAASPQHSRGTASPELARTPPRKAPFARAAARPWYGRWWVWTLAGAVLAGSAAAIIATQTRTERSYEFRFEL